MPAAIETNVKTNVIKQWLSGDSRDRIAADNNIGAGTVSNIINELKKGVEDSDYDSLRELTVSLKKQGIGLIELFPFVRLYSYIQKLSANQDQIESFIANLANSPEPEKLIDTQQIKSRIYQNLDRYHLENWRATSINCRKKSKGSKKKSKDNTRF